MNARQHRVDILRCLAKMAEGSIDSGDGWLYIQKQQTIGVDVNIPYEDISYPDREMKSRLHQLNLIIKQLKVTKCSKTVVLETIKFFILSFLNLRKASNITAQESKMASWKHKVGTSNFLSKNKPTFYCA